MTPPPAAAATSARRRVLFRAIAVLLGLGFAVGSLELVVRLGTKVDDDGNQTFMGGRIRPFHPPVEWTRRHATMLAKGKAPCFRYDPALGWTNNPATRCHDGQYAYDATGIRAASERGRTAAADAAVPLLHALYVLTNTNGDDVAGDANY